MGEQAALRALLPSNIPHADFLKSLLDLRYLGILPLKPFHPPFRVHNFLRPRKKRVAARTNINLKITHCGPGLKFHATSTTHGSLSVVRMDPFLHELLPPPNAKPSFSRCTT